MKTITYILGILGLILIFTGSIIYAIRASLGILEAAIIWIGLLLVLFFFYVNFSDIRNLILKRSTRYGFNMTIMIIIFSGVIVLVGFMSVNHKGRYDLTKAGRFTLSEQTIKILKSLKKDVKAVAFYRSEEETYHAMVKQKAEDLLQEYSYHTPKFTFKFIDPDRNPGLATKYGVTEYRIILLICGSKQEKIGFESEEKFTNALIKVTRDEVKTIYFLKGHGENDISSIQKIGYKAAKDYIERENYHTNELLLMNEDRVPKDASVVLISGPRRDFLQDEIEKLKKYVEDGGSLLFMIDPGHPLSVKNFLESYGLKVGDDIIVDKQSHIYGSNYLTPIVYKYDKDHPLTRDFNLATYFYLSNSIDIEKDKEKGRYSLAQTGPNSWAEKDMKKLEGGEAEFDEGREKRGPISIAAVTTVPVKSGLDIGEFHELKEKKKEGRLRVGKIIAFGDSDFANNTNINLAGNGEFFLNTIGWLAEEADLISVRAKDVKNTQLILTVAQGRAIFWIPVVVIPSLVLISGIGIYSRRRWMR
jgi:ABC-type uncharacterized transport system involved in gliding motility auxiliary subunit